MASASSPTSVEWTPRRWTHDVFLSFRGQDTRWAIVSHLDRALAYWGAMKIFKDDRDLEVGATIRPELLTAIEESYLAIIVLSSNYASSTWCLDELSKILECMEDTKRILPIFFHVDPSEVRYQRGSFAEAFTKHEKRFSGDSEKLNQWRAALRKVADLSGLHSTTYKSEAEFIENIVKCVRKKVNPTLSVEWTPCRWTHDVFLSFRGEDTRWGFMSHLDYALGYWRAMKIFKDDRDLEVGATISPELLTAIEESRLAIIVLSPNYASSTWCLDELSKILECMVDTKRILPIFYRVDPSDVRYQRGSFAEAFTKHEKRFSGDSEKLNQWRVALRKVADLSGLHSTTYKSESELIKDIVIRVRKKVNPTFTLSDSEEKLVGFDFALDQLLLHLAPEEKDVRFVGIWGMGGVGKTTLAKLVYQNIYHHFDHFCFLSNVRKEEVSGIGRQLLSSILKENYIPGWDEGEGTCFIKNRLGNKKVLLVLDDVDHRDQLNKLVGNKNWFGDGSRIIITTRNERLLDQHDIAMRYKVEVLKNDEALELFSRHAFKKDQPAEGFQVLSKELVCYAKGLPLALTVLGISLYRRGQDQWKSVLQNLKKNPNPTVFDSLKVSYDGLEKKEKNIFLHVACLHRRKNKEQVIETLDFVLGDSSLIGIDCLIEKSLLTIDKHNIVEMHDLIQEMAWIIVRQPEDLGQHSILWCRDDIFQVVEKKTGTSAIECIVLRLPELEVVPLDCTEAFNKMDRLKLLDFDNVVFSSGPSSLPNSLRIICWSRYPSNSLPSRFDPHLLAKLEMRHSKLVRLWNGTQDFPNLKYVDLSYSENLTRILDFTRIPNVERLVLEGCKKLREIHSSIAVHKKLRALRLKDCKSIECLPSTLEMDSLEILNLQGCSKVKKIPEFGKQMKNLSSIWLAGTAIEQIPSSIEHLVGLQVLRIDDCKRLLGFPSVISKLKSLKTLWMGGCSKVDKLTGEMDCLEDLDKSWTSRVWCGLDRLLGIRTSPDDGALVFSSVHRLCFLRHLDMSNCNIGEGSISDDIGYLPSLIELHLSENNFVSLPASIRFLSNLHHLVLRGCKMLEQLPNLPSNRSLKVDVNDCTSLKMLSDPSKLGEANVYDFSFTCWNCFRLVEEEGWINRIFAMIMRLATKRIRPHWSDGIGWPGSEIPEWFNNQSVGDSVSVELPPQPSCSSDFVGIGFCVVFYDSDNPLGFDYFEIELERQSYLKKETFEVGYLKSKHLWVFFLSRDDIMSEYASRTCRFSIRTYYSRKIYYSGRSDNHLEKRSIVKKCGARLVYQRDLEDFSRVLKFPEWPVYEYGDEAGSSGSGSGSDDDDNLGIYMW